MYFLIPGKNKILSEIEIKNFFPKLNLIKNDNFWLLDKDLNNFLTYHPLAGFLKYGIILDENQIKNYLLKNNINLIGTNDNFLAKILKKQGIIKKYKILKNISNSILEIKNKGIEILKLKKNLYGITTWFQPIDLYEVIDYGKSIKGMKIGMMPAKLTHLLLNIGLGKINIDLTKKNKIFIYDTFVGFGTTGFLANALGFNFIGSDINITPAKENLKWWKKNKFYKKDLIFELFKQDICKPLKKNFLKKTNLIITEGYLGPAIKNHSELKNKNFLLNKVLPIYKCFFENIVNFFKKITVITTIPDYIENKYIYEILPKGLKLEILPEIYKRKNQFVGRKILIINDYD